MLKSTKCFIYLGLVLLLPYVSVGQVSHGGTPPSFAMPLLSSVPTTTLHAPNTTDLIAQAETEWNAAQAHGDAIPYQVAEPLDVSLNLNNSGRWETLPNGGRIWRLRIYSPGAQALHLIYNRWLIPAGGQLFLYNDSHSQVLGSFTAQNNWIDTTNVTGLIRGEATNLEYYLPAGVTETGELSIFKVLHHFRGVRHPDNPLDSYGDANACHVNINCPQGAPWQTEKHAVTVMFMPSGGSCTGALINNRREDGTPYYLSAFHCYPTGNGSNFLFVFNYESPGCMNQDSANAPSLANALVMSRWNDSDFLLLRLSSVPPISYTPYYAGWDRTGATVLNSVGIHHPRGDIKKISIDNNPVTSSDYNGNFPNTHWQVVWDVGTVEPGSSGSPLFSPAHQIIGQAHGGIFNCPSQNGDNLKYGKFSVSWDGGGTPETRLSDWLDPTNTGLTDCPPYQPDYPHNDNCFTAPIITSLPYEDTGNTYWAAPDNLIDCFTPGTPQVTYILEFDCDYNVHVSMCGSLFDTKVSVNSYGCDSNFYHVPITCVDDGPNCNDGLPGSTQQAQFDFIADETPHTEYYVTIGGYNGAAGYYHIRITGSQRVPSNDQCPGISIGAIGGLPFTFSGNTRCALHQYGTSCANDGNSPDVVFNFVPPCDGYYNFSTCADNGFNSILELKLAQPPGLCSSPMTTVACNDNYLFCFDHPNRSFINAQLSASSHYYLFLKGYNGDSGPYTLTVDHADSPQDRCPGEIITSLPFSRVMDDRCFSDDYTGSCGGHWGYDAIFQYTATSCRMLRLSSCFSAVNTMIYVRRGGACPGDIEIACNDNHCGLASQLDLPVDSGTTYYFILDTDIGEYGSFNLGVSDIGNVPPVNDVCFGAPIITSLPYTDYGSTLCANYDYLHCGGGTAPDVVYKLQLPYRAVVTANTCGSDYDTYLDVRTGPGCSGDRLVSCTDDDYCDGVPSLQSGVGWGTDSVNAPYYIIVHGFQQSAGHYQLNVTGYELPEAPPPVNDMITTFNITTGDVTLSWTPVAGADVYNIYRSSNYETLFDAANIIATVSGTSYVCAGCMNDFATRSFFGVLAENQLPPGAIGIPSTNERKNFPKSEAAMGKINPEIYKVRAVEQN